LSKLSSLSMNDVIVCDLMKEKRKWKEGKAPSGELELKERNMMLTKKFVKSGDGADGFSLFAERVLISMLAEITSEENGEKRSGFCEECGLLHKGHDHCPPELGRSSQADRQHSKEETKITSGRDGRYSDQDDLSKADRQHKKITDQPEDKGTSRMDVDDRDKSQDDRFKAARQQRTERERGSRTNRHEESSDEREYRWSLEKRDRSKKVNFTEECMKCLQDHSTWGCWVAPTYRCPICKQRGHAKSVHYAEKDDVIKRLTDLYGDRDGYFKLIKNPSE